MTWHAEERGENEVRCPNMFGETKRNRVHKFQLLGPRETPIHETVLYYSIFTFQARGSDCKGTEGDFPNDGMLQP